jgi:hypothetical protein
MLRPDRWNARCPRWRETTSAEKADFLRVGYCIRDNLTDWEAKFVVSAQRMFSSRGSLTAVQEEIFDRWLLRKIWDNDPGLWAA